MLSIDVLFRAVELNIHVGIHGDQSSFVFGLTPLEPYNHLIVDPAEGILVGSSVFVKCRASFDYNKGSL